MDKQPLVSGRHADDDTIVLDGEESNGGDAKFDALDGREGATADGRRRRRRLVHRRRRL